MSEKAIPNESLVVPICRLCGQTLKLTTITDMGIAGVTSDCKPFSGRVVLYQCPDCHLSQKVDSRAYRLELQQLYSRYDLYYQANGQEQKVFTKEGPVSRSDYLVGYIRTLFVERNITMLDFGAGGGQFILSCKQAFPLWNCDAYEPHLHPSSPLNATQIITVHHYPEQLHQHKYQLITLIHVIEHVLELYELLQQLFDLLQEDGFLLVQCPDIDGNPLDYAVVDHCSHFSKTHAGRIAGNLFSVVACHNQLNDKEMTLLLRKKGVVTTSRVTEDKFQVATHRNNDDLAWLASTQQWLIDNFLPDDRIFGSAIAAAWAASVLQDSGLSLPRIYLDEDESRQGTSFCHGTIIHPRDDQNRTRVLLPYAPQQATQIARNLQKNYGYSATQILCPPRCK